MQQPRNSVFSKLWSKLHSDVKFSCQENQFMTYVHSCPKFVILIKTNTNNPEESLWFLNLLSNQAWASSFCPGLV